MIGLNLVFTILDTIHGKTQKKVLNPKILGMYVGQLRYDIDAERFEVRLTEDKEFECD